MSLSYEKCIPAYTALHTEALEHGCLPLSFVKKLSDMMAETQALTQAAGAVGSEGVARLSESLTDALYYLAGMFEATEEK